MKWGGNTWNRARDLERWLMSVEFDSAQEWGRKKSRDFMYNIGYESPDKEVTAERNKQFVGNIILIRGAE